VKTCMDNQGKAVTINHQPYFDKSTGTGQEKGG